MTAGTGQWEENISQIFSLQLRSRSSANKPILLLEMTEKCEG